MSLEIWVFSFLAIALLVMGGIWFYYTKVYNIRAIVREVANNRKVIRVDKARMMRNKDGLMFVRLLKEKAIIPEPPSEAIEITDKGRKFIELYKFGDKQYQYALDTVDIKNAKDSFSLLNINQRMALVNQEQKAASRKNKSFFENIKDLVVPMAFVLIIIVGFIFWEDIWKPVQEVHAQNIQASQNMASIAEDQKQTMQILNQIILDKQSPQSGLNQGVPD